MGSKPSHWGRLGSKTLNSKLVANDVPVLKFQFRQRTSGPVARHEHCSPCGSLMLHKSRPGRKRALQVLELLLEFPLGDHSLLPQGEHVRELVSHFAPRAVFRTGDFTLRIHTQLAARLNHRSVVSTALVKRSGEIAMRDADHPARRKIQQQSSRGRRNAIACAPTTCASANAAPVMSPTTARALSYSGRAKPLGFG